MELSSSDSNNLARSADSQLPVEANRLPPMVRSILNVTAGRQFALILGCALVVAVGVAIVLWSRTPEYKLLFSGLPEKEVGEILEALEKLNIDFKIEPASGAIKVPEDKVHEVRFRLARQGLPKSDGYGYELLDKEAGFGTSQLVEAARYQRALEGEIARSIMTIQAVKAARVHLALPKESVFVRQAKKPSASVLVDIHAGRSLEKGQVEAIVHLVASGVPHLEPEQVTLVDQRGQLLNAKDNAGDMSLTSKQFDYKKRVEDHLIERVENILIPLVGREGLRTQVTADIDFTVTERTQELFNPELPALRSEQTTEEHNRATLVQGVPGALSNQPPAAGTAPEIAGPPNTEAAQPSQAIPAGEGTSPASASKSATRNYELDKTISHSRLSAGGLRRLTVAVVIDNQRRVQDNGSAASKPFSDEDIAQFGDLVKEAVGFDIRRGDRITVTNVAFKGETIEPMSPLPLWQQAWFPSLMKQAIAGLVVILLIITVLRPLMKGLVSKASAEEANKKLAKDAPAESKGGKTGDTQQLADDKPTLQGADETLLLEAPQSYEKRLEFARKMVDQDPKRVAQVVKTWIEKRG
jgi:flagellar M-ring protein FliF